MSASAVLSWIAGNKTTRKQAVKRAAKVAKRAAKVATGVATEASPVVTTVRAIHGVIKVGEAVNTVNEVASNINDFIPRVSNFVDGGERLLTSVHAMGEGVCNSVKEELIPSMQVVGNSLCYSTKIFTYFNVIAGTVGLGANIVQAYQGIDTLKRMVAKLDAIESDLAAKTTMTAQENFSGYVYDMVSERIGQTSNDPSAEHWFFVYHPDTDWYPKFYRLLEEEPLSGRFCGYTNQIDTAFVFMLAARKRIQEKAKKAQRNKKPVRPVKLHLLIPAYQRLLITEALEIPDNIGDFAMEGRIHNSRELVWLNLPKEQRRYVVDIGQWVPPEQGIVDRWLSKVGLAEAPPVLGRRRVLGTQRQGTSLRLARGLGRRGRTTPAGKGKSSRPAMPLRVAVTLMVINCRRGRITAHRYIVAVEGAPAADAAV